MSCLFQERSYPVNHFFSFTNDILFTPKNQIKVNCSLIFLIEFSLSSKHLAYLSHLTNQHIQAGISVSSFLLLVSPLMFQHSRNSLVSLGMHHLSLTMLKDTIAYSIHFIEMKIKPGLSLFFLSLNMLLQIITTYPV